MITLTSEQVTKAALAAQASLIDAADAHIHRAIEALCVEPGDVSDEQYDEILNIIFQ